MGKVRQKIAGENRPYARAAYRPRKPERDNPSGFVYRGACAVPSSRASENWRRAADRENW
jgi:hypothetical protein